MYGRSSRIAVCVAAATMAVLSTVDARGIHPLERHNGHNDEEAARRRLFEQGVQSQRRARGNVPAPVPDSPDAHLVESLPLLDAGEFTTKHWAGLLPASGDEDKYLFYWLFAPDFTVTGKKDDDDVPLILWLNGGPACSSMDGLWLENGPLRIKYDDESSSWKVVAAPHSWHKAPAYTLYIDQPVGTGLSYTTSRKYPRNDEEVNVDMYYFLQQFFSLHADKMLDGDGRKMRRPFYWSGESHAGHYIPSMMNYIRKQNEEIAEKSTSSRILLPLSGAAIGNGYFSPMYQYSAHEAAYGHGLIGKAQRQKLEQDEMSCQSKLREAYASKSSNMYIDECMDLLEAVKKNSEDKVHVSSYDVRTWEPNNAPRTYPQGHQVVESYLGGRDMPQSEPAPFANTDIYKDVLKAIHSEKSREAGQEFRECTDPPYNALYHQDGLGVEKDVIELLEHGDGEGENAVRLLFFNGVEDLICNHVGNEVALEMLDWAHRDEWIVSRRYGWRSALASQHSIGLSGYMKEHRNLSYLKVLNSGHMVPMDVPDVALDMVRTFVYKESFEMYKQPTSGALAQAPSAGESCPKAEPCPTCPAPEEEKNGDDSAPTLPSNESSSNTSVPSAAGIPLDSGSVKSMAGYVLAAVFLVALLVSCCVQRYSKPKYSAAAYDGGIELPSSYTDNPDGDDEEEEGRFT